MTRRLKLVEPTKRTRKGAAQPLPTEPDFADCHTLGHAWRHLGRVGGTMVSIEDRDKVVWRPPFGAFDWVGIHSQCVICTSERVKWMTRSGSTVNRYRYVDGYCRTGPDRMSKQEWRQTYVVSMFEDLARATS